MKLPDAVRQMPQGQCYQSQEGPESSVNGVSLRQTPTDLLPPGREKSHPCWVADGEGERGQATFGRAGKLQCLRTTRTLQYGVTSVDTRGKEQTMIAK